ncbi:MAG TPA: lactate racemase domain-containing protein [Bryobacteraceae bacterium]|nr:lactate racemase domain-containing protein [Bryobacteraceae bacterium]
MPTRRTFLAAGALAAAPRSSQNVVALRTHEWFDDRVEEFPFPPGWRISVQHMKGWQAPPLAGAEIRRAVESPVGTKRLQEIAAGRKTVAIAFDDLTRPTPTYDIVPHVVRESNAAGIRDENILFVTGYGCHYQMNGMEVARKLGQEAVRRHPWINHNIWENLADVGTTTAGNRIRINTYYNQADVKITISGLKAHGTPGYGGGPKLILPGISGFKTIRYMHKEIQRKRMPPVNADGIPIFYLHQNEQRRDMIEAARLTGVDFSVQCVYNQERRAVNIVAGDVVDAHNTAARYAVNHLYTDYARDADVVVVNAYPKGSQLHEHFGWGARGLKPGGSIVVINQNPMGEFAWHYLDEEQFNKGKSWFAQRDARQRRFPEARQVLLYSQYLQRRELDNPMFPPEAIGCHRWQDVVDHLEKAHKGSDVHVAVYPYAGMQHGPAVLDNA